jgi:hypothetical protein
LVVIIMPALPAAFFAMPLPATLLIFFMSILDLGRGSPC